MPWLPVKMLVKWIQYILLVKVSLDFVCMLFMLLCPLVVLVVCLVGERFYLNAGLFEGCIGCFLGCNIESFCLSRSLGLVGCKCSSHRGQCYDIDGFGRSF